MKYIIYNKNIPLIICVFSVIVLSLYTAVGLYNKSNKIEDTFRLHVVANSNNVQDQIVKLKVANKIESYVNSLINNPNLNKLEVYKIIYNNMDTILTISNNELKENNINYASTAKLGKINYEEKENIHESMQEGSYDSLQILLGKAEGKNYWNLIFPNKDNIQNLKGLENVLPGISDIYTNDDNNIKEEKTYSFKILEIFENIF